MGSLGRGFVRGDGDTHTPPPLQVSRNINFDTTPRHQGRTQGALPSPPLPHTHILRAYSRTRINSQLSFVGSGLGVGDMRLQSLRLGFETPVFNKYLNMLADLLKRLSLMLLIFILSHTYLMGKTWIIYVKMF